MSICMVGGLLVSSIVSGRRITTTGRWKRWLVSGMVLTVVGLGLLGTIDETTDLRVIGLFMAVLGVGLGATMQNLVLAVQNNVPLSELGAASSVVAFFRSLGGSVGVSALGALLSTQVAAGVRDGLSGLGGGAGAYDSGEIPDLTSLPAPVRAVFEQAYGESFGHLFLVATPLAVLALVCVVAIREVPLRTTHDIVPVAPADSAPEATADLVEDAEVVETRAAATLPPR
jgi:MFS family permease